MLVLAMQAVCQACHNQSLWFVWITAPATRIREMVLLLIPRGSIRTGRELLGWLC